MTWLLRPSLVALLFATTTLTLAVALISLLRVPKVNSARVLLTAALVAALSIPSTLAAVVVGGLFAAINVPFLVLGVVVPACGVTVLLRGLRSRAATAPALFYAVLGSSLALPAAWAVFEPLRLELVSTSVPLAGARKGAEPLTIGILADLQTDRVGLHERRAVKMLMDAAPDVILIPGDLFQGDETQFAATLPDLRALLASLSAPGGVFFVSGNTDFHQGLDQALAGTGIQRLRHEEAVVDLKGRRLRILGLDEWESPEPRLSDFASLPGDDEVRIVLVHRPGVMLNLPDDSRVDLLVGGHTHGGQIQIPGFGPPLDLSPLPRHISAGGLHWLYGNRVYVSRGVGLERGSAPRIRFLAPPEVSLLTLE